jgi:photosystem II stability/assembly factor-like uncharacterized protein
MNVRAFGAAAAAIFLLLPGAAGAAGLHDVLDTPSEISALAPRGLLNGLARAGKRIVAVGQRGHIVYSDDAGRSWVQARVPVSSDLVAVAFPTPLQGWAVGHDGIVLHSSDGGASWIRQMDGRTSGAAMLAYYQAQAASGALGAPKRAAIVLEQAKRFAAEGAQNPLLDVWFADERTGYVVGAFNLIFRTTDGGKSWEPWLERTDNPKAFNFYAIRPAGGALYIAGEQGLLLRLDGKRFRAVEMPYKGTLFGITGDARNAIVFGLRGTALRSTDGGTTWQKVATGVQAGLTGGTAFAGGVVLVSQAGDVLVSKDDCERFEPLKIARPLPAAAVVGAGGHALVIAGPRGVRALTVN